MVVALAALLAIWQTSVFLEYEEMDGVMVQVPQTVGSVDRISYLASDQVEVTPLSEIRNRHVVRQRYDYSCGSAALTTVLNHFLGLELDESRVMNGLLTYGEREKIVERRGFSLADMKRFVSALGYKSGGFRGEVSDLQELTQPAIIPIHYGDFKHFVVLRNIVGDRVFIADPAFGNLTLTISEFEKLWGNNVLFLVYATDEQKVDALEISDEDLAYMDEERVYRVLNQKIPEFYHAMDREVDFAAENKFYYRP